MHLQLRRNKMNADIKFFFQPPPPPAQQDFVPKFVKHIVTERSAHWAAGRQLTATVGEGTAGGGVRGAGRRP